MGFPEFVKVLVDIGFLRDEEQSYCKESIPWKDFLQKILTASSSDEKDLVEALSAKTTFKDNEQRQHILTGLKWLGMFSSEKVSSHVIRFCSLRFSIRRPCATMHLGSSEPGGYAAMARLGEHPHFN